jgi:hypothetical protein
MLALGGIAARFSADPLAGVRCIAAFGKFTASPQRSPETQIVVALAWPAGRYAPAGTASYLISKGHLFTFALAFLQCR